MPEDFSLQILLPTQDTFGRPVQFNPIASQPGGGGYTARGIYESGPTNDPLEDESFLADQITILDIRNAEFVVLPIQGDQLTIPPVNGIPGEGDFEVIRTADDGGGETTLVLRKIVTPTPFPPFVPPGAPKP